VALARGGSAGYFVIWTLIWATSDSSGAAELVLVLNLDITLHYPLLLRAYEAKDRVLEICFNIALIVVAELCSN
jgi:hypothetical protein